jgi:hypothetical protein
MIGKEKLNFDPSSADTLDASDSVGAHVRAGDDGTLIGHVSDALKVNFSNTSIAVTATDLDIRDLAYATDSVTAHQGTSPWVVSATDLDIRDLAFATDKVDVSGSSVSISGSVAVTQSTSPWVIGDGGGSITVDAVNLDIRDLTAASDSVQAWAHDGAGTALTSTLDGGKQALDVHIAGSDISIDVDDRANTALLNTQKNVTNTSAALLASQQSNRRFLYVQNLGNVNSYVGASGVSTATGIRMSPGTIAEFKFGPALSLHAVAQSGTQDFRIMEAS